MLRSLILSTLGLCYPKAPLVWDILLHPAEPLEMAPEAHGRCWQMCRYQHSWRGRCHGWDVPVGSHSLGLCLNSAPELSPKAALLGPLCAQVEVTKLVAVPMCQ